MGENIFRLYLARPDEIERARAEHRAVQASMNLSYMPPDFDWVTIFVDNRGGPPQTVSIGELQEQVPAGAAQRVLLPHSDGCDKAKMCASMKRLWHRSTPAKPC